MRNVFVLVGGDAFVLHRMMNLFVSSFVLLFDFDPRFALHFDEAFVGQLQLQNQ
jgi:hypothetical protein